MSIYDFKIRDIDKNKIGMSDYEGKVLLIVNTATGCAAYGYFVVLGVIAISCVFLFVRFKKAKWL